MGLLANYSNARREAVSREQGNADRAAQGGEAPGEKKGRRRSFELIESCHAFSLLGAALVLATVAMPSDMEALHLAFMLVGGGLLALGIALGFVAYFAQLDATSGKAGARPKAADPSSPPRGL